MPRPTLAVLVLLSACATAPVEDEEEGVEDLTDERACPALRGLAAHCGELLDEPVYVTLIDQPSGLPNDVSLLGAMSGNTCRLTRFPATNTIDHVTSLAMIGTDVFYCAATAAEATGPLTRISLLDGSVTASNVRCLSTTSFEDRLLVMSDVGSTVQEYETWDAVLAATSSPKQVGECAIRLGAGENKLYSTWPMPTEVYVFDPELGSTSQLPTAAGTIGVTGIAAQRGTLSILDGVSDNHYLYSFDAKTGAPTGKVIASTQVARLHGLTNACKLPVFE